MGDVAAVAKPAPGGTLAEYLAYEQAAGPPSCRPTARTRGSRNRAAFSCGSPLSTRPPPTAGSSSTCCVSGASGWGRTSSRARILSRLTASITFVETRTMISNPCPSARAARHPARLEEIPDPSVHVGRSGRPGLPGGDRYGGPPWAPPPFSRGRPRVRPPAARLPALRSLGSVGTRRPRGLDVRGQGGQLGLDRERPVAHRVAAELPPTTRFSTRPRAACSPRRGEPSSPMAAAACFWGPTICRCTGTRPAWVMCRSPCAGRWLHTGCCGCS